VSRFYVPAKAKQIVMKASVYTHVWRVCVRACVRMYVCVFFLTCVLYAVFYMVVFCNCQIHNYTKLYLGVLLRLPALWYLFFSILTAIITAVIRFCYHSFLVVALQLRFVHQWLKALWLTLMGGVESLRPVVGTIWGSRQSRACMLKHPQRL